jgi:predicted transcriptional regulator of viral defense system
MIVEFLKALTEAGYRLFTIQDAKKVASILGILESNVHYILRSLTKQGMIRSLYRGTYAVEDNILSGSPIHKFEVAMHLSRSGAICCWSALAYHELSDQILSTVFVFQFMPNKVRRSDYKYQIDHSQYQLIQVGIGQKWGIETIHLGETNINITDLERTLLDGLIYPQYCGGIREVMNSFLNARNKINVNKLLGYAKRTSVATQKRLGWMLSHLDVEGLSELKEQIKTTYYDRLNPLGVRRGKYNKEWMILENF